VVGDCCDLELMKKLTTGCDLVYHCAASAYEGLSVFSPALISRNIYQATVSTLTAAISSRVKRFVYMSSMSRYGDNPVPFTESMPQNPKDPYALAKVASENIVKMLAQVHDYEYVITIPHNIYGPQQKFDDPFRNVVSIFINQMVRGKRPFIYGDGNQKRCVTYIKDVLPPLLQLKELATFNREVFNIGPDSPFITINQLAREVAKIVGVEFNPIYFPDRPLEVREANCSADKSRRLLGFAPHYSLADGISETVAWIRPRARPFEYHIDLEIENERTPRTWKERMFD